MTEFEIGILEGFFIDLVGFSLDLFRTTPSQLSVFR